MKIGILTLPLHINYGGILQAYALQTVLERMGHDVVVYQKDILYYKHQLPLWKYPFSFGKRLLKKVFVDKRMPLNIEKKRIQEEPIIRQHLNQFIKNRIHSVKIEKPKDIDLSSVDCIIVGSDQIWRPVHLMFLYKSHVQESFLDFAKDWKGKRIAYAASFGVDKWEFSSEDTSICKELAKLFDAISVREDSGVQLCKDYLGIKADLVLDPTLLLQQTDYIKLIKETRVENYKGKLFGYILDKTPEKIALVEKIAKEMRLQPFYVDLSFGDIKDSVEQRILPSVEQWLTYFYDAEYVVTDSFHGCVFSIIFNKRFVTIGNEERGMSRFKSLLSLLGLESRLFANLSDVDTAILIDEKTDYEMRLSLLRQKSMKFLTQFI